METKKNEEMKRKAEVDSGYSLKPAQRKEQQIIEQARKQANEEATKILNMVEEKGRQIISESVRFAEAKAAKILAQAQQEAREIVAKAREQVQSDESKTIPQNGEQIGQTAREAKNVVIDSQLVAAITKELDKGFGIVAEATKRAETEANKIIAQAKETGSQIIEEATRKREGEAKKIVEEATRKAEEEGNKIVTQALQTGLQIIVEAARLADTEVETTKRIPQGEPKVRRLIEEAKAAAVNRLSTDGKYREAEHEVQQPSKETKDTAFAQFLAHQELAHSLLKAPPIAEVAKTAAATFTSQTPESILEPVEEETGPETNAEGENQTAVYQDQVELAIMPPIDFFQLERLRKSLQRLRSIRILSTEGYTDGRTAIYILLNRPSNLITALTKIREVEEALGEETLDSHPLGESLKKTLAPGPSKRNNRRRIVLVLKKTER